MCVVQIAPLLRQPAIALFFICIIQAHVCLFDTTGLLRRKKLYLSRQSLLLLRL
jgi:hypothetical protein